jgi:hypothetical protein
MDICQDDCICTPRPPDIPKSSDVTLFYRYPIVFAVITLLLSVVYWTSGFGCKQHWLPTETYTVEFIYSLSGALNILLFIFTKKELLLPRNRLGMAPDNMLHGVEIGPELERIPPAHPIRNGLGETPGNVRLDVQTVHNPRLAASEVDDVDLGSPLGQICDGPWRHWTMQGQTIKWCRILDLQHQGQMA